MKKRKPGRPPRAGGQVFPQDEVLRILVEGELVIQPGGQSKRGFPGTRTLANRYGVSPSTISRFARKLDISSRQRPRTEQKSRPRKEQTSIPWNEIERLLIEGERFHRADGQLVFVIPEITELAVRFGVSASSIRHLAKDRRCTERRNAMMNPVISECSES
jgi:DNA-binding transcriptional regulator YhcF (GntR family)